ncbi:MAG: heparinase II/III family protein [Synoicihabitans sp.]
MSGVMRLPRRFLFSAFALTIPALMMLGAAPGSFTFSTEVKRPDMTREAKDTAPKYNPTSHVRTTTKEDAGNYRSRDILGTRYSPAEIRAALESAGPFRPFPAAGDAAYRALPVDEQAAIITAAEAFLDYDWPTLTMTLYLDHYETGSLRDYQLAYFQRMKALETLLYAEVLEGKGRFVRDIANGIWAVCEQTSWAQPAHLNVEYPGAGLPSRERPVVALLASEVAALVATAEYFLGEQFDAINPVIRERMQAEVHERILQPYLARTDYWWMAYEKPFTNNWNPWITSNYLLCALTFSRSEAERAELVLKAVDVLDHFLNVYPEDGGCEEGPAYWDHASGRLLDCMRLLNQATGGLVDISDEPLVREMGNFMWYASIHAPWYVNFADARARYTPDPSTLFRYGKTVGSENLQAFAADKPIKSYLSSTRPEYLFMRQLPNLFIREELVNFDRPFEPNVFTVLPDLETAYVRQCKRTDEGFYLAAKGGYNAESHNHNDVGSFLVFLDGEPLLIDAGVGTYTSKTFSEQRYEIWSMQSSYHNLPDINGVAQPHMIQWKSDHFEATGSSVGATIEMGIASAYPPTANLADYRRTLRFDRVSERITLRDALAFRDGRAQHGGNSVAFHLMTHHVPSQGHAPGTLLLTHPDSDELRASVSYPSDLDVLVTKIVLEDPRMAESWGDAIYRITLSDTLSATETDRTYDFEIKRSR